MPRQFFIRQPTDQIAIGEAHVRRNHHRGILRLPVGFGIETGRSDSSAELQEFCLIEDLPPQNEDGMFAVCLTQKGLRLVVVLPPSWRSASAAFVVPRGGTL